MDKLNYVSPELETILVELTGVMCQSTSEGSDPPDYSYEDW